MRELVTVRNSISLSNKEVSWLRRHYGPSPYAFCMVGPFAFRYSERSSFLRSKIDDGLLAPASENAQVAV